MPEISFTGTTFTEALEYFRTKLVLTPEQFGLLSQEAKSLAFTVSRVSSLDVLLAVHQELEKALTDGATLRDFRRNASDILERKGFEGLTPFRADNIFRTNIQTAYQVGRYQQQTNPDVIRHKPFWMYSAVGDHRTRPEHLALDGKVYPADHSFWDIWYPPNGYRCRCTVIALSEAEIERRGLTISDSIPHVFEGEQGVRILAPDEGFGFNPGKVAWEADLSKYPAAFRQAYEEFRKRFAA